MNNALMIFPLITGNLRRAYLIIRVAGKVFPQIGNIQYLVAKNHVHFCAASLRIIEIMHHLRGGMKPPPTIT